MISGKVRKRSAGFLEIEKTVEEEINIAWAKYEETLARVEANVKERSVTDEGAIAEAKQIAKDNLNGAINDIKFKISREVNSR